MKIREPKLLKDGIINMRLSDFLRIKHIINDTDEDNYLGIHKITKPNITFETNDDMFIELVQDFCKFNPKVFVDCVCETDKNGYITFAYITFDNKILPNMLRIYKYHMCAQMINEAIAFTIMEYETNCNK